MPGISKVQGTSKLASELVDPEDQLHALPISPILPAPRPRS